MLSQLMLLQAGHCRRLVSALTTRIPNPQMFHPLVLVQGALHLGNKLTLITRKGQVLVLGLTVRPEGAGRGEGLATLHAGMRHHPVGDFQMCVEGGLCEGDVVTLGARIHFALVFCFFVQLQKSL